MNELILHHYAVSPFSEKIRKVLAAKGCPWRGVDAPMMMPKPKLTPLTGGYRRIPVLQIGADVYCDTALMARVIEARHPTPALIPEGSEATCEILSHWADHWLFRAAVPPALVALMPMLPKEFLADRQAMSPGFNAELLKQALPGARSQLHAALEWLDRQLEGRPFLLGESFSLADASCFHVIWFLRNSREDFARSVEARPSLKGWFERVDALGAGAEKALDADEALAVARDAQPSAEERADAAGSDGIAPGDRVTVSADDYGMDPISGTAVVVTAQEIALRRSHEAVGDVVVHFPRIGYRVEKR